MGNSKNVFKQLATKSALLDAWRVVQKKRSAGGIDKVSVGFYEKNFDRNIDSLLRGLSEDSYVPEPYERILASKEGKPGEYRPLSLPTINDKIVQQALRQILEPIFNPNFLDISYAYRPGKGPAKAISRISHIISTKKIKWAVCADIDRFFDTMDHKIVLAELQKRVNEPGVSKLISMWLKIGVVNPEGSYVDTPFGVAQGGVISPLLSNIYLHPLDNYLTEKSCHYIRYADNFILMRADRGQIEKDHEAARYFLKEVLKLRLNHQKRYIFDLERGFVFMGIFFKGDSRSIDHARIQRMENRLNSLVWSKLHQNPNAFFKKLEEKVSGFMNYYGRLLEPKGGYSRLNLFLRQTVIKCLFDRYKKKGNRPNKTEIKALLAPIKLFGSYDSSFRDQWVKSVSDLCLNRFEDVARESKKTNKTEKESSLEETTPSKNLNPEKAADQAVKKQKDRYRKLESVSREVVIESRGVFVGKSRENLVVKKRGVRILDFPLQKLQTVNVVAKGITISSDIILHCNKASIPIFFSDWQGLPECVIQSPMAGDPTLGLMQLQILHEGHGALELAKEFVEGKIRNQINLLKYYGRHRPADSLYGSALAEEVPRLTGGIKKLGSVCLGASGYDTARNKIMGFEAEAARRYWKLIKILLADEAPDFPGRERKGARDLVNSLLNYGYGFLYRQVWRETVISGLNPKISFLHTPQGDKPTLVYDLVEEFRPQAVDRVIFSMLTKNEKLKLNKKTGYIEEQSRKKLLEALLERQGASLRYHGEKTLLKNVIKQQARKLCLHLRGKKTYRHFIGYY